jgi:hypothetical protein
VQSVRAAITQLAALSMHINDTVIPKLADIVSVEVQWGMRIISGDHDGGTK